MRAALGWIAHALLFVGTVAYGTGVLMAVYLLQSSTVMLERPGALTSPAPWAILASLALYPVLAVLGLRGAWAAYDRGDSLVVIARLGIPLFGAGLVFAAYAALVHLCNGDVACG